MITVGQHLDRVLSCTRPLPEEKMPLAKARGLCLAEPGVTRFPVPPWDNSAMDGYAVRLADVATASADRPVTLRVVADLPAGTSLKPAIGPGETARIMTGAPVPPDAEAVVPVELTDGGTGQVRIFGSPGEKTHIRRAGEDRRRDEQIAAAGTVASPEVLSSLAAAGYGEVTVRRRPLAAVIATGDELVPPGEELSWGRIPDSNSLLLGGLVREAGGELVSAGRAGDAPGLLGDAIGRLTGATDLILLSGGISAGAFEPVRDLFAAGGEVQFDRVTMQPGKPQAFGRLEEGPLVFGLPGNPVSAWVSFHVFVKPCLRKLLGCPDPVDRPVAARAVRGWNPARGRAQYLPAVIAETDAGRTVAPAAGGGSGSHLVASLAAANGYAIVPDGAGPVEPGATVATVLAGPPSTVTPDPAQSGA